MNAADAMSPVMHRHVAASGLAVRACALIAAIALLATACGGQGLSEEQTAVVSSATENQQQLQLSGDLASTQVLDGTTGEITSLGGVVAGDRAVLVWYWAPN